MIRVEYGVITEGAKEGFVPELLHCSPISNKDDLSKNDLNFKNFANPCERYAVLLDGRSLPIPENTQEENMGVWSLYASNEYGEFENYLPTVILSSEQNFDSEGLVLTFDNVNNIYPTIFSVSWYSNDALIIQKEYRPESASYSVLEDVEGFDKIEIVFQKMNTPYSRMKFRQIEYGSVIIIDEKSIKNMRLHQIVNPISTTVPTSTLDLKFLNSAKANYNFAARQSLKIMDNNVLAGKYFIESADQTNTQQWSIRAQDYIGMLEGVEFEGGIYVNEMAINILTEIFNKSKVPFEISEGLGNISVTGYIPYATCRKALQQVLFAIGAYASTAYSESVVISEIGQNVSETIGLDRIFSGQVVSVDADATEIELIAHAYTPIQEETILHKSSEYEENVRVIFSEPAYDLRIENGEIIERGTNYAIVTCQENGVLYGKKYEHTMFGKSKRHESAGNKRSENKKTVKSATLISSSNVDKILDLCYNYITKNTTVKSKIVEDGTPLVVGKTYEIETELLGKIYGVLNEQSFSLYGGKKVVKETVIK